MEALKRWRARGPRPALPDLQGSRRTVSTPTKDRDMITDHVATLTPAPDADPAGAPGPRTPVARLATTLLPTVHGDFQTFAYADIEAGVDHLALVGPGTLEAIAASAVAAPLVRVHSECITGEALGSLKCECGPQLQASLATVHERGGVIVYLRGQEGRGIGLANKMRTYALQETGVDTLDANLQLGFPADARDYTAAAEILADLGISRVTLLTNNPEKMTQLDEHGIEVVGREPLVVGVGAHNAGYLETKRTRMGHLIPAGTGSHDGL
ncbi:GTP cyclohydrolase II [Leucobacter sp. gxy201]|uniref:GTP cyclohydrolase II n=1 Tax=Leucobacter sp. gxy201 TaxID=2957200 RepID=UPI003DA0F841